MADISEEITPIARRLEWTRAKLTPLWNMSNLFADYYQGLQTKNSTQDSIQRSVVLGDEDINQLSLVFNRIRFNCNAVVAKLLEYLPRVQVNPTTTDEDDVLQAEAAEKLINAVLEQNHFSDVLYPLYYWLLFGGQAFFYVHASKKKGKPVIFVDVPHPQNVLYDLQARDPTLQEARWAAVESIVNREDLKAIFPRWASVIDKVPVPEEREPARITSDAVDWNENIKIIEYWEKSTPAHPEGRHFILMHKGGDNYKEKDEAEYVVLNETYDGYGHGELPVIRVLLDYGSRFVGTTPLSDMAAIQDVINLMLAKYVENVDYLANPILYYVDGAIRVEEISNEPGQILSVDPQFANANPLGFLVPPQVGESYFQAFTSLMNGMDILMGLTPLDRGEPIGRGESATAWQMSEVNRQKLFRPRLFTLALAMRRVAEQILGLAAEFMRGKDTLSQLVGKDMVDYAREFLTPERVYGPVPNISVDVGQNSIFSRALRPEMTMELVQRGIIPMQDPAVYQAISDMVMRDLGIEVPGFNQAREAQRRLAQEENRLILEGKRCPVAESDDHVVHMTIHKLRAAQIGIEERESPEFRELMAHIQAHDDTYMTEIKKQAIRQIGLQAELATLTQQLQKQVQESMGVKTPQQVSGERGGRPRTAEITQNAPSPEEGVEIPQGGII